MTLFGAECLSDSCTGLPRTTAGQTESDCSSPETISAGAHVVRYGPQYPDVFVKGKSASILSDSEKISVLEGKWESSDLYKYTFPSRFGEFIVL